MMLHTFYPLHRPEVPSSGRGYIFQRLDSALELPLSSGFSLGGLSPSQLFTENKRRLSRRRMGDAVRVSLRTESKLTIADGIVIVDHGSRRPQSNAMLHQFVRMYKERTGRSIVEAAHMELAQPTISEAFDRCVQQGATRIIISPYFLSPGRHWDKDIPLLAAEAAKNHVNVAYMVTAPIGLHERMVDIINDRMEYCLSQAAGEVSECDVCRGSGRCRLQVCNESAAASGQRQ